MTNPGAIEALARRIAEAAHAGQVDKAGEPYIGHVARVAARLDDPLDRAVGWLHDVVEDTGKSRLDLLREAYPLPDSLWDTWARVVDDVLLLTHRPHEPRVDYYERIKGSSRAVRVKLADIADNSDPERLAALDDGTRARLREKYRKAREALEAETVTWCEWKPEEDT